MPITQLPRFYGVNLIESCILFFRYFGHIFYYLIETLLGRLPVPWFNSMRIVYYSGVKMLVPLVLISSLMCASLIINFYFILSKLLLEEYILRISQNILFYDLLPFLIGLVLSIQLALNLVNPQIKKLPNTPEEMMGQFVIPLLIGGVLSALLIYAYCLNAIFLTIYFCFRVLLNMDIHEYLIHLTNTITTINIFYSILKTVIYCLLICLVVGYYYYAVASRHIPLRKAMTRIMSRSLICLTISSLYFKFFSY